MKSTVLVGLSGGIDSFVTALLLQRQGYTVVGVHLCLWNPADESLPAMCRQLGIELLYHDGRDFFREEVVDVFVREYISGRTPSPCATCNSRIKWRLLCDVADRLGIEKVASGHYVRTCCEEGLHYICKGADPVKDQSYFLWQLTQEVLSRMVTPLGTYSKDDVRKVAKSTDYEKITTRRESMGVCFLEGRDYRQFIADYSAVPLSGEGLITDATGLEIGRHNGLLNYTIGQKRDIPVIAGAALYVSEIDVSNNRLVVDRKENLYVNKLKIRNINLPNESDIFAPDIEVKVRGIGLNPAGYCWLEPLPDGSMYVHLSTPAWAVAPGQPVVFYRGTRLIGGGIAE